MRADLSTPIVLTQPAPMTTAFQLFFPAFCATIPAYIIFVVMLQNQGTDFAGDMAIIALTFPALILGVAALIARPKKIQISTLLMLVLCLITALAALVLLGIACYHMILSVL